MADARTVRHPLGLCGVTALVAFALGSGGCATTGSTGNAATETRDAFGFTIHEDVRVSGEVLDDFDQATRLLAQEQYEQAIVLLEQVVEAVPDATAPHINLGIAYSRVARFEAAEASVRRALAINPRHPVAHNELGMIYRKTGRFDAARASYEAALAEHPEFHFARLNLAILCDMYLQDADCALEHYEIYSEAVPDDEEAAIWIADLRNRTGR